MLAGGRSTRFGADKLASDYRGMPLLHHAVLRLAEVCDEVVVVLAPDREAPGLPPGVLTTHDATEGEGPLAGLHAGLLSAVRSDWALVAAGDMPDLQTAVLLEMLRVAVDTDADAVALQEGDKVRPVPCALRTWPAAEMAHALLHAGRRRFRDMLDSLRTAAIDEATWTALDPERLTLVDVDTPEDLDV